MALRLAEELASQKDINVFVNGMRGKRVQMVTAVTAIIYKINSLQWYSWCREGIKILPRLQELGGQQDLDAFVNGARDERVLTVVAVTATSVSACVHVFPAVVALAKSFDGYAVFGRLVYDATPQTSELARALKVMEVRPLWNLSESSAWGAPCVPGSSSACQELTCCAVCGRLVYDATPQSGVLARTYIVVSVRPFACSRFSLQA